MPSCWKLDFRIREAQKNVTANAQHEVTNRINDFFHHRGGDQMPMTTPSAATPASMSDNYGGGHRYRRRNNRAEQIGYDPQQVIGFVSQCLRECDDQQHAELLQGLTDLLEDEMGSTPATDQSGQGSRSACR